MLTDAADFLRWFVTQDETLSPFWTKIMQVHRVNSYRLPKPRRPWPVFYGNVLMIYYLQKAQAITEKYCAWEIRQFKEATKEKCRGNLCTGVLLQQYNAPLPTAQVALAKPANCGFELRPQVPDSSDLAPSHFFLFAKLKCELCGRRHKVHPSRKGLECSNVDELSELKSGETMLRNNAWNILSLALLCWWGQKRFCHPS